VSSQAKLRHSFRESSFCLSPAFWTTQDISEQRHWFVRAGGF